jgi:LysM repeat protein
VGKFNKLYLNTPQEANFAVLRAPDIPSVLIETDFISSPDREKLLKKRDFQNRFAEIVAGTVAAYLEARPETSAAPAAKTAKSQAASPPASQADKNRRAGGKAAEQQKPSAKPAGALPLQAPPGGKYRILKKSATEYALVPVAGQQTGVQSQPPAQPAAAAPAKPQTKAKVQGASKQLSKIKPEPPAPAAAVTWHVVKKGENLSSIAKKYRISLKELCRQNGLALTTKVEAGVKLKIVKQKSQQR